jgi:hypothetical protein
MVRTRAQPPAIASRQPVSPHRQATPGGRNLGVPEFACAADGSPLEHAAGDDARTRAGRGLDEEHVVETVTLPAPWLWHIIGFPSDDCATPLFLEHGVPVSRTPIRGGACVQPFITVPPSEKEVMQINVLPLASKPKMNRLPIVQAPGDAHGDDAGLGRRGRCGPGCGCRGRLTRTGCAHQIRFRSE